MGTTIQNATGNTVDRHLKRGVTLIELIVTLTILGTISSVAVLIVSVLANTYRDSQFQSLESTQMQIALQQILRELSAAFPPSVETSDSSIQFQQVFTAGFASSLENGALTDFGNPLLSQVQAGMRIAFDSFMDIPDYFTIHISDPNQSRIDASGITPDRSRRYWILHRAVRYVLEKDTLWQSQEIYCQKNSGFTTQTLCNEVTRFSAYRSGDQIILELESSNGQSHQFDREIQSITLN